MFSDFSFLDYIWRGLFVTTVSSSILCLITLLVSTLIAKKSSSLQMKYFYNIHSALFLFTFIFLFSFVVTTDRELAVGCFNQFAKENVSFFVTRCMAGVWLFLTTSLLLFDLTKMYRFFLASSKEIRSVTNSELSLLFSKLVAEMRLIGKIEFYQSSAGVSPFVFGFFKNRVIVPDAAIQSLNQNMLKSVIAHELVHVRDHDTLWLLLNWFYSRVMFFSPLVLMFRQKYLLVVEMAADEGVIDVSNTSRQDLINSLIELAAIANNDTQWPLVLNASQSFKDIKKRIEALAQNKYKFFSKNTFASISFVSLLTSICFSFAHAKIVENHMDVQRLEAGPMCSQLNHEKLMESWLNIKAITNKCEK